MEEGVRVDQESGLPLVGAEAPTDGEQNIGPKELGDYKKARKDVEEAEQRVATYGFNIVLLYKESLQAADDLAEAIDRRTHAAGRIVKASGINHDRVTGIDLERGMLKYHRKDK